MGLRVRRVLLTLFRESLNDSSLSKVKPRYLIWFLYSSGVLLIIKGVTFRGYLLVNRSHFNCMDWATSTRMAIDHSWPTWTQAQKWQKRCTTPLSPQPPDKHLCLLNTIFLIREWYEDKIKLNQWEINRRVRIWGMFNNFFLRNWKLKYIKQ